VTDAIRPNPGFDPARINWLGPDQPLIAENEEHERCSYCGDAIPEDSVPLRMWNRAGPDGAIWGAVFCDHCMTAWWGFRIYDEPPEPKHEPEVKRR
jgi:hypothetical protein